MASQDPDEPEPEPESEELTTLLTELQSLPELPLAAPSLSGRHERPDPTDPDVQRAEYQRQLARTAARVLVHKTGRSPGKQRSFGIPDSALTPQGMTWLAAVADWLSKQPPEHIFDAWVSTLDHWYESAALNRLATAAAAQLVTIAPHVDALAAVERSAILNSSDSFIAVLHAAPVDAALVRLVTKLLPRLQQRSTAEQKSLGELAGSVARKRPELAVTLAATARALREQSPRRNRSPSEDQALATAVCIASRPELMPTALLGLTAGNGWSGAAKQWAQALARCNTAECLRRFLDPERGLIGHSFAFHRGIDVAATILDVLPEGSATESLRRNVRQSLLRQVACRYVQSNA